MIQKKQRPPGLSVSHLLLRLRGTAALARQQDSGVDLVSKRIDVEGKGVGTVTDVHTALGKPTQHVVLFDNGARELLTLCKDPTSTSRKGHKFYVI